jgi:aspartate 1-decarboxylase
MRRFVAAKLHGIYVTAAILDYHGSITLDPDHCEEVGIFPLEFVEIWNMHSAARISTYVILGERGSRCCVLNGAAARTCQPGDRIIICSSIYRHESDITQISPKILTFNSKNEVVDRMKYEVRKDEYGSLRFSIISGNGRHQPGPRRESSSTEHQNADR